MLYLHYAFTADPARAVRIDPYPRNSSTPIGFYTYSSQMRHTFAVGRPFIFVLRDLGTPLLSLAQVTQAELPKLTARLAEIAGPGLAALQARMTRRPDSVRSLARQHPGAMFYYLVTKIAPPGADADPDFRVSLDDPHVADPRYATELFQALGYGGISDTLGAMYSSEPEQAVFFTLQHLQLVEVMPNPKFDGRPLHLIT